MRELEFFENAIKKERLSHLYLLSGKSGIGKLELAYNISYLILKNFDKNDNLLNLIKSNLYNQVHFIEPDGNVIKKEQIISLQNEFSKTSLANSPRIYIINNADSISTQAANSLLKFMEEPESSKVYGILISSNISKVLPTIISRAQVIRVQGNNDSYIYDFLKDKTSDTYHSRMISYLTQNESDALAYLEDEMLLPITSYIKEFIMKYHERDFSPTLSLSKDLIDILYDRKYYQIFLELLLINIQDLLKFTIKEEIKIEELNSTYEMFYKNYDSSKIMKISNIIQEELKRLSIYINIGLSLEVLMINIK